MLQMTLITVTVFLLLFTLPFREPQPHWLRRRKMARKREKLIAKYDKKHIAENLRKLGWKRPENIEISVRKISHPKKNDVRYRGITFGKGQLKIQMSRRRKLRYFVKKRNTRLVGRALISVAVTILIYYVFHVPVPFIYGAINTWDNSDADNVYSNDNNWSLGHKPAGTEDVIIPDTSVIGKCTMDENSAADLATFTVQANGEFEAVTFTLDVNGDIDLTGTFTRGTGTIQLGGGGVQNITSGGNALYHVIITGAGTIFYMKDDTMFYDVDMQTGTTFEADAVSEGHALSIIFSDIAGCGFLTSQGHLLCQGDGANHVTITSENAPPGEYWTTSTQMDVTADFTTFEYLYNFSFSAGSSLHVEDSVIQKADNGTCVLMLSATNILSFVNNTISGDANQNGGRVWAVYHTYTFQNITVVNSGTGLDVDVRQTGVTAELVNCAFDITNTGTSQNNTALISKHHNGVAGAYNIVVVRGNTLLKSTITNDFTGTDNVTLYAWAGAGAAKLQVDEAMAHIDMTIQNNTELEVNAGIAWTTTHTTGLLTIEAGGTLDVNGIVINRVVLRSSAPGTTYFWDAQVGSTVSIEGIDVQDCDASAGEAIDATDGTSVGEFQNNTNWLWPGQRDYVFPGAMISHG